MLFVGPILVILLPRDSDATDLVEEDLLLLRLLAIGGFVARLGSSTDAAPPRVGGLLGSFVKSSDVNEDDEEYSSSSIVPSDGVAQTSGMLRSFALLGTYSRKLMRAIAIGHFSSCACLFVLSQYFQHAGHRLI